MHTISVHRKRIGSRKKENTKKGKSGSTIKTEKERGGCTRTRQRGGSTSRRRRGGLTRQRKRSRSRKTNIPRKRGVDLQDRIREEWIYMADKKRSGSTR